MQFINSLYGLFISSKYVRNVDSLNMLRVPSVVKTLVLILSIVLLSACSSLGSGGSTSESADAKKEVEQGANLDGKSLAGTKQSTTPTVVNIPKENPYLTNQPPVSSADQKLFAQALSAAKAERWDQATALFQSLTKQNPALSGPYLNLGVIAQKQDQLDQAEAWFKKAIQVNANNLDAYTALALLYKNQAKFAEAKEQLTKAVTIWPLYPAGHRNLGILNEFYLGDFKAALKHYKTYQGLLEKPDRKIKGWIIDLERRIPADPEEQAAEVTGDSSQQAGGSSPESTENNGSESVEGFESTESSEQAEAAQDATDTTEADSSIEPGDNITVGDNSSDNPADNATEAEVSDNENE